MNRAKDQILTQLAAAAEGELPSVLVESAYQREMAQFQQQLQMQRTSLERYLSQTHQTRESFTEAVRSAAEKNTRARMALLQIAQDEGLLPTDAEMDQTLTQRAEQAKKTLEEVKEGLNLEAMRRTEGIRRAADSGDRAFHHSGPGRSGVRHCCAADKAATPHDPSKARWRALRRAFCVCKGYAMHRAAASCCRRREGVLEATLSVTASPCHLSRKGEALAEAKSLLLNGRLLPAVDW